MFDGLLNQFFYCGVINYNDVKLMKFFCFIVKFFNFKSVL